MPDRVADLGRVADFWLDRRESSRNETVEALRVSTGLTVRQVELGLDNCFAELTEEKLRAALQSYSPRPTPASRRIWHVLPANVFTAWIPGATLTLLTGHTCLLKPSTREPIMARAWAKSVSRVSSVLGEMIHIQEGRRLPAPPPDLAVVYGNDETLAAIRFLLPAGVSWLGYGHQMSVAVLFQEGYRKARDSWSSKLVADALPFDLKGCLSPQVVYVEKGETIDFAPVARELRQVPVIHEFDTWETLGRLMEAHAPHLSCIGVLGSAAQEALIRKESISWGASRVCPLGQMQRPPLSWRNGGVDFLELLYGTSQIK